MYKVGEYVVKANAGICVITEIVQMALESSTEKQYYVLLPKDDKRLKMFVPVDADRTRIRPVMTGAEAMDFIYCMDEIEAEWILNDKQREQRYKETLRSNDPADLVSIIKSLYQRGQERLARGKKITATDERYFKQAEEALYTELGFALEKTNEEVRALINSTMEQKKKALAQA